MANFHELVLVAGDDHVARVAHEGDPLRAVIELIWNAIDAEADDVAVALERDEHEAIRKVIVTDDGHGISVDEVESTFGHIGDSWKRLSTKTKNDKRSLHGKNGEGRLRIFALGNLVDWQSISRDTSGQLHKVAISGSATHRQRFPWSYEEISSGKTGTTVTATNESQKSLGALEHSSTLPTLLANFAPVLLHDQGLSISYDGTPLNPDENIEGKASTTFQFGETGPTQTAELLIIEWKAGKHRTLHFGADDEHFVYEESLRDLEASFNYSAYVTWSGFDQEALSTIGLGESAQGHVGPLYIAARRAIADHFTDRRRQRRREQVKKWKEDKVYPYEGEPETETERAERAVFDVVSGTLSTQISGKKSDTRLTLALLKSALRAAPESLQTILHEVVSLNEDDRDALTSLLGEVTLPAIIKAANLVTNRNKFLLALEHILFDPEDSGTVGEKAHLHPLLEQELWIFGEAYNAMNSERGLTELLRTHLKLTGLPSSGVQPVKLWDGKSGRIDLHLAAQAKEFDRVHHLVVELKAPGVELKREHLDQVENYANAILSNDAFASGTSTWEFVLVGTSWDGVVENRLNEDTIVSGQFFSPAQKAGRPRVRGYVRKWRDVIDENKRRLEFMRSALEHDPSLQEGLGSVRERWAAFLPEETAQGGPSLPLDQ